ncbi:zinc ribbon domain-containing protein [Aquabacter sp. P-9]|uniref:zinc ribbon domain-containing protein n=1 Tax=Aquabacter sediminis TaxID=3029197 RepID=UPI00237E55F2|nr:hypothetical protein [Aquabacter sp. P-9]MDE1569951.1 hypothetical protein [Aquabacter sp. P-9]
MSPRTKYETQDDSADGNDLPLDDNFVEQAEYISEDIFLSLNAYHPDQDSIIQKLSGGGAKLLVGPRGCGKTTSMLTAYHTMRQDRARKAFALYVNFKLSLKLEPLYIKTPNAGFWFRTWLNLKIIESIIKNLPIEEDIVLPASFPVKTEVERLIASIESGNIENSTNAEKFTTSQLCTIIEEFLEENSFNRCVLLLDDAAHAFSPRQQEDFFEFFREVKTRKISPKAAIYPGITNHSPSFHVGHDAEQIDVWVKPNKTEYLDFMFSLAEKRFNGELPTFLARDREAIDFLAFASFGIPRSFLNMLRTIYHESQSQTSTIVDRRQLMEVAKQSRELSHNVYDALRYKLPTYRSFVDAGNTIYDKIISVIKTFNRVRPDDDQALEVGLRRPIDTGLAKVVSLLQYSGLLMPAGENRRGEQGTFDIFMVHFGDLIVENAIIGRKVKSVPQFLKALTAQTHQAWPRLSSDPLITSTLTRDKFVLSLPNCQSCGAERANEHAKFCANCGSQLTTSSLYHELTSQGIEVLNLSESTILRIKKHSKIRTIRDILIDTDRKELRGIPYIGPVRAARIATLAEEHVA